MKKIYGLLFFLYMLIAYAQESGTKWQDAIRFSGYVKYINILNFHDADDMMTDNMWHNRLNFSVDIGSHIEFHTAVRNRIFYGDMLKSPFFDADKWDSDAGWADLTFLPLHRRTVLVQTAFDRMYAVLSYGKWEAGIGRQRINWGINTVWNPNDLFNASNFLDFDYEEKPGSDAVSLSYETGDMSRLEIVFSPGINFDHTAEVWAGRYQFNFSDFDIQLITAKYKEDINIGLGWAGNVQNASFKGEAGYFLPLRSGEKNFLIAGVSLDYGFKNGINWSFSGLYNGNFDPENTDLFSLLNTRLDVRNLFPSEFAFYNGFSGNFNPKWQWHVAGVYGTEHHLTVIIPQVSYSIYDNWSIDLTGQSFFAGIENISQRNILYFRLGWYF